MFGIELSMIWAVLIAVAVFLYVALDGFDLGVGILFPFAKNARERDQMQAAIAPVWDGNETWLVLGGGGLLAAFPKAYAALMPALYIPIILMLLALIFRGVAFEFRHQGRERGKTWWTVAFAAGSIAATLAQGMVLGGFIQGVRLEAGAFAGGPLDWLTPFTLLVSIALVAGYALLGAAWLVFKTQGALFERARGWVKQLALLTALAMGAVSLATLGVDPRVTERWGLTMTSVDWPVFARVAPLPLLAGLVLFLLWRGVDERRHLAPYLYAVGLFLIGYLGLAISLWPYIVPFAMTPAEAAAADNALALMLYGALPLLPLILGYTAYVYWIFRAKVDEHAAYH
ncbi:MAG TPA: cytochrome d ubiquinol oxidase subunit II [Vitreimonas sp.]|uniref:cytochrome d ubiquinol oxidase subunit II n=1 Tax=Vitreimonas sp. TaxID=3069702 RepID=UPI002D4B105A|nr:cytochrome d ubiquinol oxidase subunit II [Vitreimonas sp.]HYD89787.1 cytochrome d ubiquinol oxidase subunit II [Vitreimonas sp.]